jgi:hypothetical protein
VKTFIYSLLLSLGITVCLVTVGLIAYSVITNDDIGPFNVHDISSDESDIQIATDLSIGKGTSIIKKVLYDGKIISMFSVDKEFGIAEFIPIRKKNRYRYNSSVYTSNPIQLKTVGTKGNGGVAVGIRKESKIHRVVVTVAQESIERKINSEEDFLDVLKFTNSLPISEISAIGYDNIGHEKFNLKVILN